MESTAYVVAARYGYVYHFAGMVSVEYNFALNNDADIFRGGDTRRRSNFPAQAIAIRICPD